VWGVLRFETRPKLQQRSHKNARGRRKTGWGQGSQSTQRRVTGVGARVWEGGWEQEGTRGASKHVHTSVYHTATTSTTRPANISINISISRPYLIEILHFLAVPQPPCCSNCVGVNMRLLAAADSQDLHRQLIFMSDRWNTPRVPLHTTLICSSRRRWCHCRCGGSSKQQQQQAASSSVKSGLKLDPAPHSPCVNCAQNEGMTQR
jgi:hypothetical protein